MSVHSIALRTAAGFESATSRLTDTILGAVEHDLAETIKAIAAEIGLCHIAYLRLSTDKSADVCLLVAVVTYSRLWQPRHFFKKYMINDPVISYGRQAGQPFDLSTLSLDDPAAKAFFADALNHGVGRNGLSIPLRNRRGVSAIVSFTSDLARDEWEIYKTSNMRGLQLLSALIDSASNINFKLPPSTVQLSIREEQCLLWAARGKTYQETAEILGVAFGSVKTHLDGAATNCAA